VNSIDPLLDSLENIWIKSIHPGIDQVRRNVPDQWLLSDSDHTLIFNINYSLSGRIIDGRHRHEGGSLLAPRTCHCLNRGRADDPIAIEYQEWFVNVWAGLENGMRSPELFFLDSIFDVHSPIVAVTKMALDARSPISDNEDDLFDPSVCD
jgi:hypothetical protein